MLDALEIKALQEQDRRQAMERQQKMHSAILVKVCGDERIAAIVRVFEGGDERRKETMFRMACALLKVREGA